MRAGVLLLLTICLGGAQQLRLEDLERMALASHPALAQSQADVKASEARRRQAGLYPNPVVGVTGDEIAAGPIIRGGEIGGFFEQRIVLGGKLGKARRVAEQDVRIAEAEVEAQRYRLLAAVRALYYQALADQRLLEVRQQLANIAREAVRTSRELANVGQADRPDLLAMDIEAQRIELGLITARNAQQRTWRHLSAVTGNAALKPAPLEGDLEKLPKLELDEELNRIFAASPEIKAADVMRTRADLAVSSARAARIPDIEMRGGVRYNRELLEQFNGALRPVGIEGFFDIGVELPIFNRNQGAIAAARAEAERAGREAERARIGIRTRAARVYQEYQDAVAAAERFRGDMLPRAREAYQLYLGNFRQMAAAYPQVLIAQRNLFQLQEDYIGALARAWQTSVELQGLVLGGVDSIAARP